MNNSKIEWCHDTANIWWGCQEVHEGCDHCYARTLDNRWNGGHWGPHSKRRIVRSVWKDLARMQKVAAAAGTIRRVFVGSMMDIFEKPMPLVDLQGNEIAGQDTGSLRDLLFQQISMGIYPNLLFLFLTKRPGNILKYIPESWVITPPSNVMYGTSVVNQETADMLIPKLLQVPGKHFLSCEPLLGPIALRKQAVDEKEIIQATLMGVLDEYSRPVQHGIDWVIAGGESGHGKVQPYIGVDTKDTIAMKEMGYKVLHRPNRPDDEDTFIPMGKDVLLSILLNKYDETAK
jgi:protein gp37